MVWLGPIPVIALSNRKLHVELNYRTSCKHLVLGWSCTNLRIVILFKSYEPPPFCLIHMFCHSYANFFLSSIFLCNEISFYFVGQNKGICSQALETIVLYFKWDLKLYMVEIGYSAPVCILWNGRNINE